jgi:hypothetical protein
MQYFVPVGRLKVCLGCANSSLAPGEIIPLQLTDFWKGKNANMFFALVVEICGWEDFIAGYHCLRCLQCLSGWGLASISW